MSVLNKRIHLLRTRGNGRRPSNYPLDGSGLPMRITRCTPMKLEEVDLDLLGKTQRGSEVSCFPEMMRLFDCFESHDFDKKMCAKQAEALEDCYSLQTRLKQEKRAKIQAKTQPKR